MKYCNKCSPSRFRNTQGTCNYQNRIHKFFINLTLNLSATVTNPSPPNLIFTYNDTILLTGPDLNPTTGLDADATGSITYPGFPILPVATYLGDGFSLVTTGPVHKRISLDTEGLVLNSDGTFWISEEYGPYIYQFSAAGVMLQAIQPPAAYIPHRNGSVSFSSNTPPFYNPGATVIPADPESGRNNNQGFEGLTSNGTILSAMLQSALNQEGGPSNPNRSPARFVQYDISGSTPAYLAEYVVKLPLWTDPTETKPSKMTKVAGQSDIHTLGNKQYFVLNRDSGFGHGQPNSNSVFRHIDIYDFNSATNIKSATYDATTGSIASGSGNLKSGITPATRCPFLDFNVNSELGKFSLHNGGAQDANLLNEKWESIALVPVDGADGSDGEWFLFSMSDNDFITQNGMRILTGLLTDPVDIDCCLGYLNGGAFQYSDGSGYNIDTQTLVFQLTLPSDAQP